MPRMIHNLLCTVSRRYRVAHCRHVDELPPRMSRKLREECREMDPRSWDNVDDFMRDLLRECNDEGFAKNVSGSTGAMLGKAAVFA